MRFLFQVGSRKSERKRYLFVGFLCVRYCAWFECLYRKLVCESLDLHLRKAHPTAKRNGRLNENITNRHQLRRNSRSRCGRYSTLSSQHTPSFKLLPLSSHHRDRNIACRQASIFRSCQARVITIAVVTCCSLIRKI
jgi:hypothetical protein